MTTRKSAGTLTGESAPPFLEVRRTGPVIASYAQNAEDVRLWRVLGTKAPELYVDIGAGDPVVDSVTKLFYDAGWVGINIEPGPRIEQLRDARPRDLNLALAISTRSGEASMSISEPDPGLSSLRPPASGALPDGFKWTVKKVRQARLEDVLAEHAPGREIDFLKIDVEGLERDVLESFDPTTTRPTVILVEAVSPIDHRPTYDEWEPLLLAAGYVFAAFDGVNRFYVPEEHSELALDLAYPISALDRYVKVPHRPPQDDLREDPRLTTESLREELEVEQLSAIAREASTVLADMERTLSWRLTRPLRTVRRTQLRLSRGRAVEVDTSAELTQLESALAARLCVGAALLSKQHDLASGTSPPLDEALARLKSAISSSRAPSTATTWLALLCATGSYPTESDVDETSLLLRSEGVDALVSQLLRAFRAGVESGAGTDVGLDVVSKEVVIDVTGVASSDLHTGVQRVAREAVARWIRTRPAPRLGYYDADTSVLRLLTEGEVQRMRGWRDEIGGSGAPVTTRAPEASKNPLVPWNCRIILPEITDRQQTRALRGLVGARISVSLSAICFDLIPIIAAEKVPSGFRETFSEYLSLVKRADRISVISKQSARDFRAFATMLAGEGLREPEVRAHPLPTNAPDVVEHDVEAVRQWLVRRDRPLILVVGSHEPRKNHVAVLEAAERLWERDHSFELLFIGGASWSGGHGFSQQIRALRERGRPVTVRNRVTEQELWAAYKLASFTVFPSLIEGFGLPVAESLASGTPAITSNYGSMSEIAAGGGALVLDPRSVDALEEQMRLLLTDDALLKRLRGEALLRDFGSWDDYARDVWRFFTEEEVVRTN